MKKLLIFGLLLTTMFACKKDDAETPSGASQIEAQTELTILPNGGQAAVGYTIKNPVTGVVLSAETDVDWITILSTDDNLVRFIAAKNDRKELRKANLTLKYQGAPDHTVVISQDVLNVDFVVNIDEVGAYGATVTYSPVKYKGHYVFFVVEKEALDPYLSSSENLEEWYKADLDYINSVAQNNNVTLEELIPRAPQIFGLYGQPVTISYSTLDINTEYYAYCYGLDVAGNRMTDMEYVAFKTGVVDAVDMTFTAKIEDITTTGAHISITPSTNSETYYWTYVSEFDFANTAGNDPNQVMTLVSNSLKQNGNVAQYLNRGFSDQYVTDMWPNTLYYIIAWGMDTKGTPTTEAMEVAKLTTLTSDVVDDCKFNVSVTEVKDMDMRVKIVPTKADTRYYVGLIEESRCAGYNDDQMVTRIINMENARFESNFYGEGVNWSNFEDVYTGEQELWGRSDLKYTFLPDHTYRIFVFGIDNEGNRTTEIARIDQTTAPTDKSNMTIKIEYLPEKSNWKEGMFRFTPSNDDEYYLPYLAYKSDIDTYYRNADGSLKSDEIMEEIEHTYDGETNYYTRKGTRELSFQWAAGMEYVVLVCGFAGSNTTEFFEYEVTAIEIPFGQSDADLTATYELFDGAELAKLAPGRFQGFEENCIIYIRYAPNDKAVHWYGGVWMPVGDYEHDGGISYLLNLIQNPDASHVDRYSGQYRGLAFQTTVSLSYVAEGADGTYGQWHYEEITPYRDGVLKNTTEAYDFWSNPAPNSQILTVRKR